MFGLFKLVVSLIFFILVLVESADTHRTDSHRDDAHGDAREGIHHSAAEVVGRGKVLEGVEHRGNRGRPLAFLDGLRGAAATVLRISRVGRQHDEVLGGLGLIFGRDDIAVARHVGLPVGNVDVEIGIGGGTGKRRQHQNSAHKPQDKGQKIRDFFDIHDTLLYTTPKVPKRSVNIPRKTAISVDK